MKELSKQQLEQLRLRAKQVAINIVLDEDVEPHIFRAMCDQWDADLKCPKQHLKISYAFKHLENEETADYIHDVVREMTQTFFKEMKLLLEKGISNDTE